MKKILILIVLLSSSCKNEQKDIKISHLKPLEKLIEGNKRYMTGHPIHPDETLQRIRELKKAQHPFAVVVSCSDSRVPPELVFDQGLGDIFSIRTAGNVIGDYELGSIEYAVEHLACKLIVVLGHENCGAVEAYCTEGKEKHHDHIQNIVDYIAAEREEKQLPDSVKHNLNFAVKANIQHGINFLKNAKPILKNLYKNKKIEIIGAFYDLDSGKISFNDTFN